MNITQIDDNIRHAPYCFIPKENCSLVWSQKYLLASDLDETVVLSRPCYYM